MNRNGQTPLDLGEYCARPAYLSWRHSRFKAKGPCPGEVKPGTIPGLDPKAILPFFNDLSKTGKVQVFIFHIMPKNGQE